MVAEGGLLAVVVVRRGLGLLAVVRRGLGGGGGGARRRRPQLGLRLRPVLADQVLRCAAGRRGGGRSGSVGAGGAGAGCWLAAGVRPGPQPPQSGGTPRPPGETDSSPSRRGGTRRGPGPRRRAGRRRAPGPRAWWWSGGARPDAGAPRRRRAPTPRGRGTAHADVAFWRSSSRGGTRGRAWLSIRPGALEPEAEQSDLSCRALAVRPRNGPPVLWGSFVTAAPNRKQHSCCVATTAPPPPRARGAGSRPRVPPRTPPAAASGRPPVRRPPPAPRPRAPTTGGAGGGAPPSLSHLLEHPTLPTARAGGEGARHAAAWGAPAGGTRRPSGTASSRSSPASTTSSGCSGRPGERARGGGHLPTPCIHEQHLPSLPPPLKEGAPAG